jgi:hypothetical protein
LLGHSATVGITSSVARDFPADGRWRAILFQRQEQWSSVPSSQSVVVALRLRLFALLVLVSGMFRLDFERLFINLFFSLSTLPHELMRLNAIVDRGESPKEQCPTVHNVKAIFSSAKYAPFKSAQT